MKMTPEEREKAIAASMNMMDQVGPEYMSAVMQSLMDSDPENLRRMMSKQTDVMFSMSQDQRRALIRFSMESMKNMTPEQLRMQKMMQEDAMAVMEEMKAAGEIPPN
jgi:hypothetical protein